MSRAQFLPVILSPIFAGSLLAWWTDRVFNSQIFSLVVLGSVCLHLAANTIDDAYDFKSGVDVISNEMFPPDFGGWKVLPRKLMTFGQAKLAAFLFFLPALAVGLYLTAIAGPIVFVLGSIGAFFAYFHVAPPLRLGYRGLGLSEIGIFLSFGVLPTIGSFYVQSGYISPLSVLVGIPLGLLTTTILVNHDQIFFDAYGKAGKRSFTVTAGRKAAAVTAFILTLLSYIVVSVAVFLRMLPLPTVLVLLSLPLYFRQIQLYRTPAQSPLHFVKLTQTTFALSVVFGSLLAVAFAIS